MCDEERDIVVIRKWRVRAATPADAILKTIGTDHDEVDAYIEPEIGKGPGGYITLL